jgi:hypothetical protein
MAFSEYMNFNLLRKVWWAQKEKKEKKEKKVNVRFA